MLPGEEEGEHGRFGPSFLPVFLRNAYVFVCPHARFSISNS